MREFDERSIVGFDGRDGRPAYVVVGDRVYDVTASPRWKDGVHMRRHHAGSDLSADLGAAPHGPEKLEQFPQVGVLVRANDAVAGVSALPEFAARILERFPVLRRHPHPMTVHFPIAFSYGALVFAVLRAWTGVDSFGVTAAHCLGVGAVVTPVAMTTGFATWKVNYLGRAMKPVRWKIGLSLLLWGAFCTGTAMSWDSSLSASVAILIGAVTAVLASVVGWIGASLTFPVERR